MSNQEKYSALRQTYPEFVYERYEYNVQSDGLHIVFSFRLDADRCFHPAAFVPARPFLRFDQPREVMDALVFSIGMIELVSYWKCACPPRVKVACGSLTQEQTDFWRKTYFHGLGEFFYVNGIAATPDDFMQIESAGPAASQAPSFRDTIPPTGRHLVPIGGGKDSVVTLELLKAGGCVPLIMNPRGATAGCIEAAGYTMDDVLVIRRTLDPLLLQLNGEGFLNGHTPFSAMLAFYTLLAAQLSGIPHIALSNENSANESTVAGSTVNHQYSKSLEFENDFRRYVAQNFGGAYDYYSFLRPLSELQIAMLFSRYRHYHPVFRSCNAGSKQDIWCGRCAKCLFAYIILSPFIAPEALNAIFGKNMLDDAEMQRYFDELTGRTASKPFECVGTIGEVHSALALALGRWYASGSGRPLPCLLRSYTPQAPSTPLRTLSDQHNLPINEITLLKSHVQRI